MNLSSVQKRVYIINSFRINPDKHFLLSEDCSGMSEHEKRILWKKVLHVLKTGKNEVHVSDSPRENSKKPLERMLELGK